MAARTRESVSLSNDMSERPPSGPGRRVTVIANPISGFSRKAPPAATLKSVLEEAGLDVRLTFTERAGHAVDLAREACREESDTIVAVGGDGTVNEVMNGMEGDVTALATLPTGTSNILARELGIPFEPAGAARVVIGNRRRRLDVGLVNGHRFLMVVGVGWDADVVRRVSKVRKGHLGQHKYIAPILQSVAGYRFPPLSVRFDDEAEPRTASLAFACNTRNYAGWFTLAPEARPDDGVLDFLLVGDGATRNFLRWGIAAVAGTLPRGREVDYLKGRSLRIDAEEPVPVQVDGDPFGTTPVEISLEPRPQEVIVP